MKNKITPTRSYCVQTLTHDYPEAGPFLKTVVDSFIKNTDIVSDSESKLDWYVRVNGINKDLQTCLDYIKTTYSNIINWHIFVGDNIGVGAGINFLNNLCTQYKYTLFIEGDWVCLDPNLSKISRSWLKDSLNLLDKNSQVSQVFLRRHITDLEDRQYGMSNWFGVGNSRNTQPSTVIEGSNSFVFLNKGIYTNNPSLKRQKDYFAADIFPLNEYYDETGAPTEIKKYHKGEVKEYGKDWGEAEVYAFQNKSTLQTFWLWPGNFAHLPDYNSRTFSIPCQSCKYGFFQPTDWFCLSCSSTEKFFQLSSHTDRGIETVLDRLKYDKDGKLEVNSNVKLIQSVNKDSTVDPKTLIDFFNNPNR